MPTGILESRWETVTILRFFRTMKRIYIILTVIGILVPVAVRACTSVIISSSASPDGRPWMWKHRDTGFLDNRLEYFKGEKYSFVGLVNSSEGELGKEVWMGSNTAGFSIMNTASYCLKNDDVPASQMDREGVLMHRALEICATLSDFEHYLDTLSRPMGVEANFGCIDAHGGAAYYETWNDGYIKRDVTAMEEGYCVVTNFSVNGRREDWKGVERYKTASAIFGRMEKREGCFVNMDSRIIMDSLSRSYEHQGDNLHIPRYITSAAMVIQGVKAGESPDRIVLWTALGHPSSTVTVPVIVTDEDHIPEVMKKGTAGDNALLCDLSLEIKKAVYPEGRNGATDIQKAEELSKIFSLLDIPIHDDFTVIHNDFVKGKIGRRRYIRAYDRFIETHLETVISVMKEIN